MVSSDSRAPGFFDWLCQTTTGGFSLWVIVHMKLNASAILFVLFQFMTSLQLSLFFHFPSWNLYANERNWARNTVGKMSRVTRRLWIRVSPIANSVCHLYIINTPPKCAGHFHIWLKGGFAPLKNCTNKIYIYKSTERKYLAYVSHLYRSSFQFN